MSRNFAEDFQRIFSGLERSSGRYVVPDGAKADAKGKVLGRAWSALAPVTLALWEAHLSGKKATVTDEETNEPITGALGLGIVPIREDNTAVFGAMDIDQYDPPIDFGKLLARVRELKLPVIVCRSKSGAPHVYLFLSAPAPATLVRERLSEWAVALGHPGVEIFPKQAIISTYSDGFGSWINIPYSGGNRSVRYAFGEDGKALDVEGFVAAVAARAITPAALEAFELPEEESGGEFEDGPPCLQTLARVGFGDWQNNGLFNVAIYLKMADPEAWEAKLDEANRRLMEPPLGHREVAAIVKSVKKKNYFYKCKDQPISAVCNRAVCLKRRHGVGSGAGDPGVTFGELKRVATDPVLWLLSIDACEIELATADLLDQRKFRLVVVEKLSKWPNPMKPDEWEKMIRERLATAEAIDVPGDATREGQFLAHLSNFCTGRARGKALDDLLRGVAFTDAKLERAFFRSTDLFAYLTAHRFSGATERDAWRWLRNYGATHHEGKIKGKTLDYWSVPAFPEQTEEHTVPRAAPGVEM